MRYKSLNDFVADLNEITKYAKERERKRILQNGTNLKDKIALLC